MDRAALEVWLLTWGGLVALLLAFLFAVNLVSECRRLAVAGFPRPTYLIVRRVLGAFAAGRGQAPSGLVGRMVWLSWDIRWLTCGETMATVIEQPGDGLELRLDSPLLIAGMSPIHRVRFVPLSLRRAAYQRACIRGVLSPELTAGLRTTAEVVVYPPPK